MFINTGFHVIVVPQWVVDTLNKNVKIESLLDFVVMKDQFNVDQLLALYEFSKTGITVFYNNIGLSDKTDPQYRCTDSLETAWFLNNESKNDNLRRDILSLSENKKYVEEIVNENIFEYLKSEDTSEIELNKPFEIYSLPNDFFVLALKKGILGSWLKDKRKNELSYLRSSILNAVLDEVDKEKGNGFSKKSAWFYWCLKEQELLCNCEESDLDFDNTEIKLLPKTDPKELQ